MCKENQTGNCAGVNRHTEAEVFMFRFIGTIFGVNKLFVGQIYVQVVLNSNNKILILKINL